MEPLVLDVWWQVVVEVVSNVEKGVWNGDIPFGHGCCVEERMQ